MPGLTYGIFLNNVDWVQSDDRVDHVWTAVHEFGHAAAYVSGQRDGIAADMLDFRLEAGGIGPTPYAESDQLGKEYWADSFASYIWYKRHLPKPKYVTYPNEIEANTGEDLVHKVEFYLDKLP